MSSLPVRASASPRDAVVPRHDSQPAPYSARPDGDADNESLVDVALVRDLLLFVLNALRRQKQIVIGVWLAFAVVGTATTLVLPRKYYSETKLLADRNVVMPLLGNPSRTMPSDADTPTRLASERIMDHANLVALIKATDLLKEADRTRSFPGRVLMWVRTHTSGPLTEDERMEDMIWTLRSRMNVQVGDGTITIGSFWTDPQIAYRIVQVAQQNFLTERQTQELSMISGSIAILERRAAEVSRTIGGSLDSLKRERDRLTPSDVAPILGSTRRAPANPELAAAQANLDATLRSISESEQFRTRRLEELQAKLAEQRNTYGPAHPDIENTQALIRSLLVDSPQLAELRNKEKGYRQAIASLGGTADAVSPSGDQWLAAAAIRNLEGMRTDSAIQEKLQYRRARLRISMQTYEELLERLEAARIELQTVRAAFPFKYGVLIPAAVPRQAVGTRRLLLLFGTYLVGALVALFAAVALDLGSGRVLEAWQIERTVGLPVLGVAPLARLTK